MIKVLLQARSNSQRFPKKSLKRFTNNMSVVELALRRAANTNLNISLVTSNEPSDDDLAEHIESCGINVYRGSLNNVLARFCDSLEDEKDDSIVVRLTGDNIFPDGNFIQAMCDMYLQNNMSYLTSCNEYFPYGLSVEVMRLGMLRESLRETTNPDHLEHVTKWIRENYKINEYQLDEFKRFSSFTCTIDTKEEFDKISSTLKKIKDPVKASSISLCRALERVYFIESFIGEHSSVFQLGGAQLGMKYGITNEIDFNESNSKSIIQKAYDMGIRSIDSAQAYGESEKIIGSVDCSQDMYVFTKLKPDFSATGKNLEEAIQSSLENLKRDCLDVVLLHRYSQLTEGSGSIWSGLKKLQEKGMIKSLGVSVGQPEEMLGALDYDLDFIQIPINVLDYRWIDVDILEQKKEKNVSIIARSVFLQGILLNEDKNMWPAVSVEYHPESIIDSLKQLKKKYHAGSFNELCIRAIRSIPWIDTLVLGVESGKQIVENLQVFSNSKLDIEFIEEVRQFKELVPMELLDPSTWRVK